MTPTFNFIKVAAGQPFPFESGRYSGYNSVFGPNETEANDWHKGEVSKVVDWYILRPVPPPAADGGRYDGYGLEFGNPFEQYPELSKAIEWFANNVPCPGTEWNNLLRQINSALMRSNWPAAGVAEPGMRWVKASDRLPEQGAVIFRINKINCVGSFHKKGSSEHTVTDRFYSRASKEYYFPPFPTIEWLDETPAPSAPSPVGMGRETEQWDKEKTKFEERIKELEDELNLKPDPSEKAKLKTREAANLWALHKANERYPTYSSQTEWYRDDLLAMFDYLQGKAITESAPVPDSGEKEHPHTSALQKIVYLVNNPNEGKPWVTALEIGQTAVTALALTPADPGSQVEAAYTEEQVREAIKVARAGYVLSMSHWDKPIAKNPDEIIKQLNP